jgi:hypothetical protein
MSQFQIEAREQLDQLVQADSLRFSMGLVVALLFLGATHYANLPWPQFRSLLPLGGPTFLFVVGLCFWLRQPREALLVRSAEGLAALLSVAAGLRDATLNAGAPDPSDLILILVGAGYFLASTNWFILTYLMALVGWSVATSQGPLAGPLGTFSLPLILAAALGVLLHLTRQKMLRDTLRLHIRELEAKEAQRQLAEELQTALDQIRTLDGLIPICAQCKKIRDDGGYWEQVEVYVERHSHASFSHGLCPHCAKAAREEWEREQGEP